MTQACARSHPPHRLHSASKSLAAHDRAASKSGLMVSICSGAGDFNMSRIGPTNRFLHHFGECARRNTRNIPSINTALASSTRNPTTRTLTPMCLAGCKSESHFSVRNAVFTFDGQRRVNCHYQIPSPAGGMRFAPSPFDSRASSAGGG